MLHLMKLSVGTRNVADLRAWQMERARVEPPLRHRTRSMPKRSADIVNGGSIYWVIAGLMVVRQRIVGIEQDRWPDGSSCAALILHPTLVPVESRPVKPFQGWRYLEHVTAPADIVSGTCDSGLPSHLRAQLSALSLI